MSIRTLLKKYLFAVLLLVSVPITAAVVSRVLTFSDGSILTAAQLNSEFNNLVNNINNLDNANLATNANILPIKLEASIAGDGIGRDGSGVLSINVDNSTVEVSGDILRVKDAGITGAKLATSAADASTLEVASGSIRIKDGGVTQAKLAARTTGSTVGAGGVAISGTVTAVNSTGSFVATGLTVTITTTGRPVMLAVQNGAGVTGSYICISTSGTNSPSCEVQFSRGSPLYQTTVAASVPSGAGAGVRAVFVPLSSLSYLDTPAAGTHTYTVEHRYNSVFGSSDFVNARLVAYEL